VRSSGARDERADRKQSRDSRKAATPT